MSLVVREAGLQSLLVDFGRERSRSLGVPLGGAADRAALTLGNALIGNEPHALAVEVAFAGPTLEAIHPTACAIFGAPFQSTVNGNPIRAGITFTLEPGDFLRLGGTNIGARAYLCVAGGFDAPEVLGSRSALEPLRAGDVLACPPSRTEPRGLTFVMGRPPFPTTLPPGRGEEPTPPAALPEGRKQELSDSVLSGEVGARPTPPAPLPKGKGEADLRNSATSAELEDALRFGTLGPGHSGRRRRRTSAELEDALRFGTPFPLGRGAGGVGLAEPGNGAGESSLPLRVLDGPQRDWFTDDAFFLQTYEVSAASNRMGLRLTGTPLARRTGELASEAVAPGAVQIANDGLPIVLGVDGQTIGGYPKVAHVIRADLDLLAQLRPRDRVRFVRVTIDEAEDAAKLRASFLREWLARLRIAERHPIIG